MLSQVTSMLILLSILSKTLNAQTGEGCAFKDCPNKPGQVRINAIYDQNNNFISGCNCGCNPASADPSSPNYCPYPNIVNYDPLTASGDCSCRTPTGQIYNPVFYYDIFYNPVHVNPVKPAPPVNPTQVKSIHTIPIHISKCTCWPRASTYST